MQQTCLVWLGVLSHSGTDRACFSKRQTGNLGCRSCPSWTALRLGLKTDRKLAAARIISCAINLAERLRADLGLRAVAAVDVVIVAIEDVIELGTERYSVLAI